MRKPPTGFTVWRTSCQLSVRYVLTVDAFFAIAMPDNGKLRLSIQENLGIEYVRCNLCGADDYLVLFNVTVRPDQINRYPRNVWPIVRCRHCGLIYGTLRLDEAGRAKFYSFENPADMDFVQRWFVNSADLQGATWRRFLRVLQHHVAGGCLLDVGCGAGTFLVEAQKAGYSVTGQEVAPYFVEFCRTRQGLTMIAQELFDIPTEQGGFDCITAFDVIEHHADPQLMLREIHRLLKPAGILMLSTHDIGNYFARHYGARWRYISPIGHLTYFTRQTLSQMLQHNGFVLLQAGGLHTIDTSYRAEARNYLTQFLRVIVFRWLILALYAPLAQRIPLIKRWKLQWRNLQLTHDRLMVRVGKQVSMNDDMVLLARKV